MNTFDKMENYVYWNMINKNNSIYKLYIRVRQLCKHCQKIPYQYAINNKDFLDNFFNKYDEIILNIKKELKILEKNGDIYYDSDNDFPFVLKRFLNWSDIINDYFVKSENISTINNGNNINIFIGLFDDLNIFDTETEYKIKSYRDTEYSLYIKNEENDFLNHIGNFWGKKQVIDYIIDNPLNDNKKYDIQKIEYNADFFYDEQLNLKEFLEVI